MQNNLSIWLIIGNPGNKKFYESIINSYKNKNIDIFCTDYPGHTIETKTCTSSLENITQHHLDFFKTIKKKKKKIIIISHSIGSWFALNILNKLSDEDLELVYSHTMLFPTIYKMRDTKSAKTLHIYEFFLMNTVGILSKLPTFLIKFLTRKDFGNELINDSVIQNCFMTWEEEKIEVYNFLRKEKYQKIKTNIVMGSRDSWTPPSYRKEIKKWFEDFTENYIEVNDIKHAFHMNKEMNEKIIKLINNLYFIK